MAGSEFSVARQFQRSVFRHNEIIGQYKVVTPASRLPQVELYGSIAGPSLIMKVKALSRVCPFYFPNSGHEDVSS
jgi:hypothetical protein